MKKALGLIGVKGPNVMMGYYKDEEATKQAFDEDGYLIALGDLGSQDENGYFFFEGRDKNKIVTANGENIYPEEIELLLKSTKYIKSVMAYEGKNNEGKTTLAALYELDEDAIKEIPENAPKTSEEIDSFILSLVRQMERRHRLPSEKCIGKISRIVNPFPRTLKMDVDRNVVLANLGEYLPESQTNGSTSRNNGEGLSSIRADIPLDEQKIYTDKTLEKMGSDQTPSIKQEAEHGSDQ